MSAVEDLINAKNNKCKRVSALFAAYRAEKEFTLQQLAAHMNAVITAELNIKSEISRASVHQWESGTNVPTTMPMAVISKSYLDIDLANLAKEVVDILEDRI